MMRRLFLIGIMVLAVAFWTYVHDLKERFPNIAFKKTRFGIASWYSRMDRNINEHTASGEAFNDQDATCASWNYAFQKKLVVINMMNGKWAVCRVNDRGPAKRLHRAIDLSKAVFQKLANLKRGLIFVAIIPTTKEVL